MMKRTFSWLGFGGIATALLMDATADGELQVKETEKTIVISRGETPVLVYHKAIVPPPEGEDPAYNRSGFIHPLYTPAGGIVTGIHPDDHFHHIGLWHAWVNTKHKDREIDFWNLAKKLGTVRFADTLSVANENDHAGFTVKQEHVAFTGEDKKAEVILTEELEITVRYLDKANIIDYVTRQKNVTDAPLELPAYRYGGCIAYRGPHLWNGENSDYLTSEGKDRTNSHQSRAKWCAMFGPTEKGDATVSILCSPINHDFPQRLRTWPEPPKMFFNYVPIQEHPWQLEPGKTYRMAYRLVIEDAKPSPESIEQRWNAFAEAEQKTSS